MFITDKFVFVHIPKTGGTFVHKVLRDLYCPSRFRRRVHSIQREWKVRIPFFNYRYREVTKHTIRHRIPEACGQLPVALAVRNPFDHFVSQFKFNWWRKFPDRWFRDVEMLIERLGPIEDWTFSDFVLTTLSDSRWAERELERPLLGPLSAEWIRFFCYAPQRVLEKNNAETMTAEVREQMQDVFVLHMETLNRDLKIFLLKFGFAEPQVAFLDSAPKIYPGKPTRTPKDHWRSYYGPELLSAVAQREWLLFKLFPQYVPDDSVSVEI